VSSSRSVADPVAEETLATARQVAGMIPAVDTLDAVAASMLEVSASVIEPRFDALRSEDVREKSPGEVVTIADQEAERLLTDRLEALLPGVPVVGEEACAEDPALVGALSGARAWLVDPLDGTANFVAGSQDWAVMVALVENGEAVASWVWQPVRRRLYVAERGAGATCNGAMIARRSRACPPVRLRGAVYTRFLDESSSVAVARNAGRYGPLDCGRFCAGVDYPMLVDGELDFLLYWRTLPWDHAPGALLVSEAGGTVRRLDGSGYSPGQAMVGLLAAGDQRAWELARPILD
jgi:fructose-1,6-bisphosphatase/inositol monophosphatase family enzyme